MRAGTVIYIDRWTPEMVRSNENWVVLFGDNLRGVGHAGQACIRDLPQAYGIPTKKEPSMSEGSFFTDEEFEQNTTHIVEAMLLLPWQELRQGSKILVLPKHGLGTGLAELAQKAPRTKQFMDNMITAFAHSVCGFGT